MTVYVEPLPCLSAATRFAALSRRPLYALAALTLAFWAVTASLILPNAAAARRGIQFLPDPIPFILGLSVFALVLAVGALLVRTAVVHAGPGSALDRSAYAEFLADGGEKHRARFRRRLTGVGVSGAFSSVFLAVNLAVPSSVGLDFPLRTVVCAVLGVAVVGLLAFRVVRQPRPFPAVLIAAGVLSVVGLAAAALNAYIECSSVLVFGTTGVALIEGVYAAFAVFTALAAIATLALAPFLLAAPWAAARKLVRASEAAAPEL